MKKYSKILLLLLLPSFAWAQETLTADELFLQARNMAFEQKDYTQAIKITEQALQQAPEYTDIAIFLGRLYTWNDEIVKARALFSGMEIKNEQAEDFFLAYASLEFWNDNELKAVQLIDKGLAYHVNSTDLRLLKAKILNSNDQYNEAITTAKEVLNINENNTEAKELVAAIKANNTKNAVGITYNFSHFDKQFDQDWHTVTLSYKRKTKFGSVIIKGNLANKFGDSGAQLEIEAYPKISKTFYLYVAAGYSDNVGLFPKYRTGVSIYANLPKSFEAEAGYRQLHFSNDIWMYTLSVGKYYKDFWFNLRTYLTPDSNNISHSYTGTVRYYTKGKDDYFAFMAGTGISPEENRNNLLNNETFKLKTFKIGAEYNVSVNKTNLFSFSAMYFNQEYRPNVKGNQYDITLGYTKTF